MEKNLKGMNKRIFMVFAVTLALLLMSLTAFADGKTITGLGTGSIGNPAQGRGGWSKLYFGSQSDPILFNVLTKSTSSFGGTTMLLDCAGILQTIVFDDNSNVWSESTIRTWLNGEFLTGRFTAAEQSAIAASTKTEKGEGDGDGWWVSEGNPPYGMNFTPLNGDQIFLLDAVEATNPSYGFENTNDVCSTRAKTGTKQNWWWLRSPFSNDGNSTGVVPKTTRLTYTFVNNSSVGVSPALNIKLSSVLFSSEIDPDQYKLTLIDSKMTIGEGTAYISRSGNTITVPYTITGDDAATADHVSLLITNKNDTWSDSGWSSGAVMQYYSTAAVTGASGIVTFSLPDTYDASRNDWKVWLLAEQVNEGSNTDYASAPAEISIPYLLVFVPGEGGSGSMTSQSIFVGNTFTFPQCTFTPPAKKTFDHWEMSGVDGLFYPDDPDNNKVKIVGNCVLNGVITVTAYWKEVPQAVISTDPAAKDLTYTGSAQELVTAGNVEGGTMSYAVGGDNVTAPASGWSNDIPKGTSSGPYYVWFKAVGDESHSDSDADCCEAEIKPKSITGASVTLDQTQLTWTGSEQSVRVTGVTIDGLSLTADDYIVIGNTGTNIDTYTLTIIGKGNFKDTAEASWQIVEKPAPEPEHSIHFFRLCEDCMLPVTGFSGLRPTALREQPKELRYEPVRMRLMIPSLNVESELVRVPRNGDSWSVDWLGADAGILAGSALPGDGLSVIAAHNTLSSTSYGPFALLSSLDMNDLIAVSSEDNSLKLFRVYANELLLPVDMERLAAIAGQEEDALVLVTCENESIDGGYLNRRVVFAKPVL